MFGLARDGHKIAGPYDATGQLWDCSELDMCGGTFASDGSYVYAPTASFPHVVGCWGPAPTSTNYPDSSCTNLVCNGVNTGASKLLIESAGLILTLLTLIN